MYRFKTLLSLAVLTVCLSGQTNNQAAPPSGARLSLVPSEPLSEPKFTKRGDQHSASSSSSTKTESGPQKRKVRLAILDLKPSSDPIYLEETTGADRTPDDWRTYRRPKVDPISRNGEGIALQGFDVVAYHSGEAKPGVSAITAEHEGVMWFFATEENRELFLNNPDQYLPEFGGFCAYAIGRGYPVTADPAVFVVDSGKLYLFFDGTVKSVWQQSQRDMLPKAALNWPKLHR